MDAHHAGDGKKRCTMAWNNAKDVLLMREMIGNDIFSHKMGSRERGNVWQHIATTLNLLDGFAVTARSVRDHFTAISRKYTVQNNKQERTTGEGGDPPSEFDLLMEELIALSRESDEKHNADGEKQKAFDKLDKEKAISIRNTAMERVGQTRKRESSSESDTSFEKKQRRSAGDTLEFLREKMEVDQETKRAERELQEKRNEQFTTLLETFQSTMQRQQEQSNQMQQQMLLLMQQQQQQLQYFIQKDQK